MIDLLDLVTTATPAEPQLGRDAHPEVRRMLQARRRVAVWASVVTCGPAFSAQRSWAMVRARPARCQACACVNLASHATLCALSAGLGAGCAAGCWHHGAAGRGAHSQPARRGAFRRDCAQGRAAEAVRAACMPVQYPYHMVGSPRHAWVGHLVCAAAWSDQV